MQSFGFTWNEQKVTMKTKYHINMHYNYTLKDDLPTDWFIIIPLVLDMLNFWTAEEYQNNMEYFLPWEVL